MIVEAESLESVNNKGYDKVGGYFQKGAMNQNNGGYRIYLLDTFLYEKITESTFILRDKNET